MLVGIQKYSAYEYGISGPTRLLLQKMWVYKISWHCLFKNCIVSKQIEPNKNIKCQGILYLRQSESIVRFSSGSIKKGKAPAPL